MKTNLTLKNIEIAGIKIEEVSIHEEYSVTEIMKLVSTGTSFFKQLLKDIPEMINDAKNIVDIIKKAESTEEINSILEIAKNNSAKTISWEEESVTYDGCVPKEEVESSVLSQYVTKIKELRTEECLERLSNIACNDNRVSPRLYDTITTLIDNKRCDLEMEKL